MLKKTLFIIIVLAVAGAALAVPVPPPFPVTFWVNGVLNSDNVVLSPGELADFKVYMYQDPDNYLDHYAMDLSIDTGRFAINALDDVGMPQVAGNTYYFATEQKVIDGVAYGVNPVPRIITQEEIDQGYIILPDDFMMLEVDGGLLPPGLPEGAVILTISRVADAPGSAIKVSWALNMDPKFGLTGTESVDIYYAAGDGAGQYPADFTVKIIAGDTLLNAPAGVNMDGPTAFTWDGQVGAGDPELYFKGCIAGKKDDPVLGLGPATAVGKVNVSLGGESATPGKNLVCYPFISMDLTIATVLGDGSDAVWENGDLVQYKNAPSPSYQGAEYKDGAWKNSANMAQGPDFEIDPSFGNWIVVKADKNISLVGKVNPLPSRDIAIFTGAGEPSGGKTFVGMVYPVAFGIQATSLVANGAENGDLLQYKESPLDESYLTAELVGGVWKNSANTAEDPPAGIATLTLPNSYIYVRYKDSGFTWTRVKP